MGVDAKLFVSNKWSIENVQEILKNHLGIAEQKLEFHNFAPGYVTIAFKYKTEDRILHVHSNCSQSGFQGILLNLRAWGSFAEILIAIGKVTGGFFCTEDYSGDWTAFEEAEYGNLKFLLEHALIENRQDKLAQAREALNLDKK